MATRKIRFDFYKVELRDEKKKSITDRTLADLVQEIWDNRTQLAAVKMRGAHYFLHFCRVHGEVMVGNMIRLRTTDLPMKASIAKHVEAFDLQEGEGMGEETSFLLRRSSNLLVLQSSKIGVTRAAFAEYFEASGSFNGRVALKPCVDVNTLARLANLTTVRKLEVAVAHTDGNKFLDAQGLSTRHVAGLAAYFAAPTVHLTVSMGREKGFLHNAHEAIGGWLGGEMHEDVTKLVVTGQTDDDEADMIDLLSDRISYVHECAVDTVRRGVTFSTREAALKAAYAKRRKKVAADDE
ncbi:MAG: hypothetical protein IAG13_12875 [Deltaproteobacteria bacterium]|nr:hypothetical protein [Nannocystaceae bacterium]